MLNWNDYSLFFGSVILCSALARALSLIILHCGKRSSQNATNLELEPAASAYLLRNGDMSHTMIVLVVDLVHRAVKANPDTQPLDLRPYEKQIWSNITDFVKRWAHKKAGEFVPLTPPANPLQWYLRARALKIFVGDTLRTFVKEVLKDPRHLKRYFSMTGIARLAIELYTSAARQGVEEELRRELLHKGMLVTESQRRSLAMQIAALIPCTVALLILINQKFLWQLPLPITAAIIFMGAANAILLRLLTSLPGFIPSYDEFARTAAELSRQGFRLKIVRFTLRLSKIAVGTATFLLALFLLALAFLTNSLLLHLPASSFLSLIAASTIFWLLICRLLLDIYKLTLGELTTSKADRALQELRQRAARVSLLTSFNGVLSYPQYDPTFSELVAVYGIETLWLLS